VEIAFVTSLSARSSVSIRFVDLGGARSSYWVKAENRFASFRRYDMERTPG